MREKGSKYAFEELRWRERKRQRVNDGGGQTATDKQTRHAPRLNTHQKARESERESERGSKNAREREREREKETRRT